VTELDRAALADLAGELRNAAEDVDDLLAALPDDVDALELPDDTPLAVLARVVLADAPSTGPVDGEPWPS